MKREIKRIEELVRSMQDSPTAVGFLSLAAALEGYRDAARDYLQDFPAEVRQAVEDVLFKVYDGLREEIIALVWKSNEAGIIETGLACEICTLCASIVFVLGESRIVACCDAMEVGDGSEHFAHSF